METEDINKLVRFMGAAEGLKKVKRTAWMSDGSRESTAEHSWRLSLLALSLAPWFPELDLARVLSLTVIHDLGECLHGDISAVDQNPGDSKASKERRDLAELLAQAPDLLQSRFLELWDEYDQATTPEARFVKAIDKMETILQHNQGANPPDFNYAFNLNYGKAYAEHHPLLSKLREEIDRQTKARMAKGR